MDLPSPLYSANQVRELDRRAIEVHRVPGAELMLRAGKAAFRALRVRFPRARRIAVVCGPGNNGGDGYVVARLAKASGLEPLVLTVGAPREAGDAAQMRGRCLAAGVNAQPFAGAQLTASDIIVDALLGTGLQRAVEGEWRAAIEAINASNRPVIAIDIPSGLNADTGAAMGAAVRADVTVSFIGLKAGLFTGDGPEHAGEILFDDLDVPPGLYNDIVPLARRLCAAALRGIVPRRARNAHKGRFGHVLVIGGGKGMSGAARMCGEAALRVGAGLVTIATHPDHAAALNAARPELLVHGVHSARELKPLIERATVVALGPGLSQDFWAAGLWRAALSHDLPLIVDADGLNLLAAAKAIRKKEWILTPHPGEAARLLKTTTDVIQRDRFAAVKNLVQRFGGVCVLKGAGTLIATSEDLWLCDRGNPGMASGGTGDVLTGVIAGLRAQAVSALDAARLGVWLHAAAGDDAALQGQAGLLASDLYPPIRSRLNRLAHDDAAS